MGDDMKKIQEYKGCTVHATSGDGKEWHIIMIDKGTGAQVEKVDRLAFPLDARGDGPEDLFWEYTLEQMHCEILDPGYPYGPMIAQFDTETAAQGFIDTEKSGRDFVAVLYFPGTYKVFERIEK